MPTDHALLMLVSIVKYPSPRSRLRIPASPGNWRRKNVSASAAFANGLGRPSTAFNVVSVSGSRFGSTSIALPVRFQFVAQHERQFETLNGKPLVHRINPA